MIKKAFHAAVAVLLLASMAVLIVPRQSKAQAPSVLGGCSASGSFSLNVPLSAGNNYFFCPLYASGGGTVTVGFQNSAANTYFGPSTTVFITFLQGASGTTTVAWASGIGSQTVTATDGVATTIEFFFDVQTQHWYTTKLTT